MKCYESTATIGASPDEVWTVLGDAAAWSSWDSGVTGVEGRVALGEKVTIRSAAAPGRAFPVKVTTVEAPHRMEFTGGMPLGLFRGVRTYTLTPDGDGTVVRMREEYTGPLLGLIWRSMPDLQPSFDQFVAGLKRRVESGA
ncbi:SRPBCC domain-containing protein [Blastococcus sp. CT_GayMR16]|uniref:SRPBCC domain-containing protein n=1 Tax=Blastococcus sp. CT_GayMR16 TaxID=2559607 RepID=UPI001073511E|nr:SRPBCC domain-containing protein [Blastococcus sp. CT_GayMR16]TFV85960.1 SRPBCC domain-containing protein [Blastococcus sp. CT_GayMR16]